MSHKYTTEEIRQIAVPIAKQYGVAKLALFGSYARGEQREDSDVDILIDKGDIRGLIKLGRFIDDLEGALGTSVDVLTYNDLLRSFISDAIRDEVVLYER
jgi:predicted nucleotidyltransferase